MILDDDIIKKHGLVIAAVYATIISHPTITHSEIAKCCCISVKSVKRALKELQQLHYITISVNKPHPNTYEVLHRSEKREQVKLYGIFKHVKLTDKEYQLLVKSITDRGGNESELKQEITRLDTFMEQHKQEPKGRSMLNFATHCATLYRWYTDDHPEQPQVNPEDPLLNLIIHC